MPAVLVLYYSLYAEVCHANLVLLIGTSSQDGRRYVAVVVFEKAQGRVAGQVDPEFNSATGLLCSRSWQTFAVHLCMTRSRQGEIGGQGIRDLCLPGWERRHSKMYQSVSSYLARSRTSHSRKGGHALEKESSRRCPWMPTEAAFVGRHCSKRVESTSILFGGCARLERSQLGSRAL